ncbi:P-loop containing nucleoside triphosphate hydrolase protein [Cristinia sonorae]|uniref:P-loop containing nucleoside triphosphate hydrolase protein n=1 Tax=Cristinia sonorae TaxID=1940300 RepID=A0A8K0XSF3_9AGAR|nr:P-loop containing nucleoside triphosphate hydrolase protein [Cristinia sonorae]
MSRLFLRPFQNSALAQEQPILRIQNSAIYPLGAGTPSSPLFRDRENSFTSGSPRSPTHIPPPPPPDGLFPFLRGRDPHKSVSLVSFAHRSRAAGGAFVDFSARYGAVREEDKRTLRETFFPETAKPWHTLAIPAFHSQPDIPLSEQLDEEREGARRALFEELTGLMGLREFLDLPVVALSNGQTRKARILKALLDQPELLILDEPLTGLDAPTRGLVLSLLQKLHFSVKPPHVIVGSRMQDPIPDWTTHVALITGRGTVKVGRKEEVISTYTSSSHCWTPPIDASRPKHESEEVLVDMSNLNVSYGNRKVLKNINWKVHANSRWHLLGSNGAGKTTLLAMLTGDHPQSYTQSSHLQHFSRPRAKWPTPLLHARIGRVSPELHNAYPRRAGVKVWDVVGTAFDGGFVPRGRRRVGLGVDGKELEEGGEEECARVERMWHVLEGLGPTAWLSTEGSGQTDKSFSQTFADRQFVDLSPGEQSVVLLMRALVNQPPLVLLDEAWAGMDEGMVRAARRYLRSGGGLKDGQACVVISHWEDEVPWGWEDGVRRFQLVDGTGRELFRPGPQ